MKKLHIIYIPGLGDANPTGQKLAVSTWKIYGVQSSVFQMNWEDKESFEPKLQRLLQRIDEIHKDGHPVALAATSAGASAALIAYSMRKESLVGISLLCGKIHNSHAIHYSVYDRNPAFRQSMEQVPKSLQSLSASDRARILSIKPLSDITVPPADTIIMGAKQKTNPTNGHVTSIAIGITLLAYRMINFLKKLP